MVRRTIVLLLILAVSMVFIGCGAASDEVAPATDTGEEETSTAGVTVDENLLTVDVTLPAAFFEDETEEDIKAEADDAGYKKAVINADGSVTYTMSKRMHREVLADMKGAFTEQFEDMVHGEDATESFRDITYNDNFSEITVMVDKSDYTDWDALMTLGFYLMGGWYQAFEGVEPDEIRVVVEYVDVETGEVLNSADSAAME